VSDACTCTGFKKNLRCPEHGSPIFKEEASVPVEPKPVARFTTIQLDAMIESLDTEIRRKNEWFSQNHHKYHSSFNAQFKRGIKTFEDIRELVRQQRQQQQMAGMTGGRIE
jgi:hypothetical protein